MQMTGRTPETYRLSQHFGYTHLPEHLQAISKPVHDLAEQLISNLPDGPDLTHGLQRLLEAKDAFVRAALPR